MRIIFLGTPDFAVASLEALLAAGKEVVAVVTAPDKPSGRGQQIQASAVKQCALVHQIPILQPTNLKDPTFLAELKSYQADLQIVVAFRMLPEVVWNMPPLGTFNLHGSLLPNYRGAAPIHWAVINGEKETGVTTFFLKHEIDTGDLLFQEKEAISPIDTTGSVYERLMHKGAQLVVKTVNAIEKNEIVPIPQVDNGQLKMAPKLTKETGKIDWNIPGQQIYNLIRGLNPFPGAYTIFDGKICKIQTAKFIPTEEVHGKPGSHESDGKNYILFWVPDGKIEILEWQMEGKKKMKIAEFLRGYVLNPTIKG
jgi:methionyl-tRNA formyltransferase